MNIACNSLKLCLALLAALAAIGPISAANQESWTGSWYSAPMEHAPLFGNVTVRTVVSLTTGGDHLRLQFSNLYGRTPLTIGHVRVANAAGGKDVTFKGALQVTLPAGATQVSDAVNLETSAGSNLVVSVYYPKPIPREVTQQGGTAEENTLTVGDTVSDAAVASEAKTLDATYFLTGVDIENKDSRGTIVVFSDSMTGGGAGKWPALLAERLAKQGKNYGVMNAAIGGNRILRDSQIPYGGPSVLSRFGRDALGHPDVRYVILFEGHNDIVAALVDGLKQPHPASTAEVIGGIRQLAARSHRRGIKLYVATLIPIWGIPSQYYSPEKEKVRQAINQWIRDTHEIDGYFDFEKAVADPERPNRIKPELEWPEGRAHPNDAGQRALSEAVDLSLFE